MSKVVDRETAPLLKEKRWSAGCRGSLEAGVAAMASNEHPWNPVPHLRAMVFRSQSGRAACSAPLDGLRALAFIWVMWMHVSVAHGTNAGNGLLNSLVDVGQCGVSVFFALSGYLVGSVFERLLATRGFRESYGVFLFRRFFRIWPALVVSVVATEIYTTNRQYSDDP